MELMKEQEQKFISGCENNGVKSEDARVLFDQIVEFANYSFNKSHSVSYAHIAYQTAYLKSNYPLEYMTSLLNANSDNLDKLTPYIDECYRLGINVLPPDINKSGLQFEHDKENNAIRFGFNGIKHVGDSSIEPLVLERSNGPIKSLSDLLTRIPSLNKTALESLIKVGAFNNIEEYPHKYLHTFEYMQKAKNKTDYKNGKIDLYNSLIDSYIKETSKHMPEVKELFEKRKGLTAKKANKEIKAQIDLRIEQIYAEEKNKFEHMEFTPDIQVLKDYEMELIGFPISNNPKKEIMELCDFIENSSLEEVKEEKSYDEIFYFMGKVKTIRRCKNGSYFVVLTDEKNDISTFMKGDTYSLLSDKLENTSNYFRICGRLNRSNNPNYDDNLKLESIRYFNTSRDKEIILRMPQTMTIQDLEQVLTNIKNDAILISDDINYRLSILTYDNKKINTKIDYWVSSIQNIGSYILKYNMTVVN
jgi:DNA polymerase III alpha subunit